jgi:ABC-type multidrug transport system fused ATPase/permease subunit
VFKILCGFYKPQAGAYRLYGHDYQEWDIRSAREQFAYVSQNVFLFPETIAANVGYGREGATFDEIVEACKNANIHEFIESLEDGYNTYVGERGVRLSGGQRQRLSIARAFLKEAPILLLDEPTSAVDVETESLIKEALDRISFGKTVITIAHRLSTIEDADDILVFDKGKVVEKGSHEELLHAQGVYHQLYMKETKESMQRKEA